MIESPLIQELLAERSHEDISTVLNARFGTVPQDVALALQAVHDREQLRDLLNFAVQCPDVEASRTRIRS